MRAVITGVSGFIGSHLAEALLKRGHTVIGIDREPGSVARGSNRLLADLAEDPYVTGVAEAVARSDVIFHLAARSGVRTIEPSIDELRFRDNVLATHNLLSVTPLDTMVVATSSSSVYGGATFMGSMAIPCQEIDALRPRGGYAKSKVGMERVCEHHRDRGGTIAVLRPFTVVGERQRPDMAFPSGCERWCEANQSRSLVRPSDPGISPTSATWWRRSSGPENAGSTPPSMSEPASATGFRRWSAPSSISPESMVTSS